MNIGLTEWQKAVAKWVEYCLGPDIAEDTVERNYRFLEESLELVQACGATKEDALKLVDYVFDRPVGEVEQEVGGVMTTLAALCNAHKLSIGQCADDELKRCWLSTDQIREKQASKPVRSPLPGKTLEDRNE